jgi:hypothetical protein
MKGTLTPGQVWIDGETYLRALRLLARNATTQQWGPKEGISLDLQGMMDSFLEQAPSFTGRAIGAPDVGGGTGGGDAGGDGADANAAPPRMPAYVDRLYWALMKFSNSPKVKMRLAEIFARQFDAARAAYDDDFLSRCKREARAVANFTTAEKVGLLCFALSEGELKGVLAHVETLLMGTPAQGDAQRWPVSA